MNRRSFLCCLSGSAAASLFAAPAHATLVIGLTLEQLVDRSTSIVVCSALAAVSRYGDLGGRRCIVTDTRVRIDDVLGKPVPTSQELMVRTLGGRVGGVGQLVLGQAVISPESPGVAFLKRGADGAHWFVGMAQGYYPLQGTTPIELTLQHSANLPEIRDFATSAVRHLSGVRLSAARRLVREAGAK